MAIYKVLCNNQQKSGEKIMKKYVLLFLVLNGTRIYGMEYISSFFVSFFKPQESQIITDLRASKDNFEKQIQFKHCSCIDAGIEKEMHFKCLKRLGIEMSLLSIDSCTIGFFQYCYYQKFLKKDHYHTLSTIFEKDEYQDAYSERIRKRFDNCHSLRDGYSAISAAMIAQDKSLQEKCEFINELLKYNFKPNQKDMQLAELIVYDEIIAKNNNLAFIHLLYDEKTAEQSSLATRPVLPKEIRLIIAQYLAAILKKRYWLLPGF